MLTRATLRRFVAGRTLEACIADSRDNMTVLRLVAALLVLFGHSYVLAAPGLADDDPLHRLLGNTYSHFVGVMAFFAVSGLLITMAWQRRPSLADFLRARALRILPALAVCLALTIGVLGPLATTLPVTEYFAERETWTYLGGNLSLVALQWQLPGVFVHNAASDVVNGSLWTLPIEAVLYMVVAALGVCGLLARRLFGTLAILVLAVAWLHAPLSAPRPFATSAILVTLFVFGALCALHRRIVPVSTGILLALVLLAWLARATDLHPPLLGACIGYATLWLAYVPKLPQPRIGDLSYGTYLWGFPVQQAIVATVAIASPAALFAAALLPTLLLAAASWRFVERPALRLKRAAREA